MTYPPHSMGNLATHQISSFFRTYTGSRRQLVSTDQDTRCGYVMGFPVLACISDLITGILCSLVLLFWYKNLHYQKEILLLSRENPHTHTESKEEIPRKEENPIQHISVKNGTRIHVIPIQEIHYIEACGDYVTLFTSSGQYVKEQTMKYFETHLPEQIFIRIHRSYILHIQQILRIEQFGKESDQIRLKNGSALRASSNGYKVLKHRLKL